jgi:hypothetical protein
VRAVAGRLPRLWRRHRAFAIAAVASLLPRILAMLAFRPALLTADSFVYMQEAVNHQFGTIRPDGYPIFLAVFGWLPDVLTVITGLQHLMGIAIAATVYGVLRCRGLPGWGATLAALPVLFDPRQIALESSILPDTLYCLVIVVATALLLTRRTPRTWQCGCAGLLLAYASVVRANGVLLVAAVAVFLLIRRVGWRALLAAAAAFLIPLAGYAARYQAEHGVYNLTSSDGMFLWSRTTSFANCAVIKPPPDLRPLCPNLDKPTHVDEASPSWSPANEMIENSPSDYLWAADAWWRHDAVPGFTARNNALALRFALDAIEKQPASYLKAVATDVLLTFVATDKPQDPYTMSFTAGPRIRVLPSYYRRYIRDYAGITSNTRAVYPYASLMFGYQQPVYFPGLLFLSVVLLGLAGVLADWRRSGGPQFLPWALAAVSIVAPAMLTQSLYRYALAAVPLACLAAGLSFQRLRELRAASAAGGLLP